MHRGQNLPFFCRSCGIACPYLILTPPPHLLMILLLRLWMRCVRAYSHGQLTGSFLNIWRGLLTFPIFILSCCSFAIFCSQWRVATSQLS